MKSLIVGDKQTVERLVERLKQLEGENARLKKTCERLETEIVTMHKTTTTKETPNANADANKACPHCGKTRCFVRVHDACGCLQCGRTWSANDAQE